MLWKCSCCGEIFDEPAEHVYRENLDGENGWYTWHIAVCPVCGDEDFELIEQEDEQDVDL